MIWPTVEVRGSLIDTRIDLTAALTSHINIMHPDFE